MFVRSLLFTHDEEREVMQEVAVVLWRKFDPDMGSLAFCRWAFGVAFGEQFADDVRLTLKTEPTLPVHIVQR